MGITRGSLEQYKCFDDCRQTGCPGHTLQISLQRTSNVFFLVIDGNEEEAIYFDLNQIEAAQKSWESLEGGS